jgi:hypothetical protein
LNGTENDLIEKVSEFKKQWYKFNIEDISFNSSVNGIEKYQDSNTRYIKGTPNHVKGVINFNQFIYDYKLNDFPYIQSGEKIKFVYLQMPNPIFDSVLAFAGFFPYNNEIENYVNRELMWEKCFIKPLQNILQVIDWNYEKTNQNVLDILF